MIWPEVSGRVRDFDYISSYVGPTGKELSKPMPANARHAASHITLLARLFCGVIIPQSLFLCGESVKERASVHENLKKTGIKFKQSNQSRIYSM